MRCGRLDQGSQVAVRRRRRPRRHSTQVQAGGKGGDDHANTGRLVVILGPVVIHNSTNVVSGAPGGTDRDHPAFSRRPRPKRLLMAVLAASMTVAAWVCTRPEVARAVVRFVVRVAVDARDQLLIPLLEPEPSPNSGDSAQSTSHSPGAGKAVEHSVGAAGQGGTTRKRASDAVPSTEQTQRQGVFGRYQP